VDPDRAERIRALAHEDIDWGHLLRMGRRHGMIPLLYRHLGAICRESLPQDALDHLWDEFRHNSRRNLFLTSELLKLLRLLEADGIAAIPLKGPVLAASVYGDLSLRQFSDLDILVHREDYRRAQQCLVSAGYRQEFRVPETREASFLDSQCELAFVRDDGQVVVELHWGITPRFFSFPLDPEWLWERPRTVALGGATVRTLPPEDLLLILCVHGAKHAWERLGWICDVGELLRACSGFDWRWIGAQARGFGSERMLFLGLRLACDLLDAVVPEDVREKTQEDPMLATLVATVREGLWGEANGTRGILKSAFFHVRARERLQDRIRYCVRLAMTPTASDWGLLSLPKRLAFLYYLVRPIRLVGRYCLRAVKQH